MILPKVTYGIIVLNGEPLTRYCLRSLYPFAHEIIVVEGAAPGAAGVARPDGHSSDSTLDVLRDFKANEDVYGKLTIVTAEDDGHENGFWPGEKDEQSQAYARRATGDYLWQVDIDEFYREEDMEKILGYLASNPGASGMAFEELTFWGGLDYIADGWYLRRGAARIPRLFRWGAGHTYVTHRPPIVQDATGQDLRSLDWVDAKATRELGIYMFHYSLLFPNQVLQKSSYYRDAEYFGSRFSEATSWACDSYMALRRPFHVHNVYRFPSWLQRYTGSHPGQVVLMMTDITSGLLRHELRPTDDIERLLGSWWYPVGRLLVKYLDVPDRARLWVWWRLVRVVRIARSVGTTLVRACGASG